jgi:acetyl-CoA carboxylase biotin carboxyl carrier protein
MEMKEIQELIKLVSKTNISELKIRQGDFAIVIKNQPEQTFVTGPITQLPVTQQQQPVQQFTKTDAPAVTENTAPAVTEAKSENTFTFKSPMIGTFYRKPGVDKDVFVKVGDTIKSGQVLCIIEAMKLFNEIEFDGAEGKIVKILVEDASPVEYDQPLFLIEKIS